MSVLHVVKWIDGSKNGMISMPEMIVDVRCMWVMKARRLLIKGVRMVMRRRCSSHAAHMSAVVEVLRRRIRESTSICRRTSWVISKPRRGLKPEEGRGFLCIVCDRRQVEWTSKCQLGRSVKLCIKAPMSSAIEARAREEALKPSEKVM